MPTRLLRLYGQSVYRRLKCGVYCYRRALRIPYVDRVTNEKVLERVNKRDCYLEKYSHRNYGILRSYRTSPFPAKRYCVGYMPGTRRQGGQRKQWVNDITDWAGMSLPEIVTLARERWQYRQIVHKVANAPHGV